MPTSTLSPIDLRPPARGRRASRVLVVVGDGATGTPGPVPEWAANWCRGARWALRVHPDTGPGAVAAAARLDARVLVLRPDTPRLGPAHPPGVVAAVRELPDDAPVVADAATAAALLGGHLTIVHAVPRSFAERSVGLDGAVAHGRRLLDAAARLASATDGVVVERMLLRVRPYELVGGALDADLLVIGGPRRARHGDASAASDPGLVAHSAVYHAPCPVLLTPR
jgi:Universal stress protein family